jgi:hypothetical protein
VTKSPGAEREASTRQRAESGPRPNRDTNAGRWSGIAPPATSEAMQDGMTAVVVKHSTDGLSQQAEKVGNQDPRDPLEGRRHRVATTVEKKGRKDFELTNCLNKTSADSRASGEQSNDEVRDAGTPDRR